MRAALALARRSLGVVWPNPAVGCVLVKGGAVVGRGWTQPGGRPHAETEALGRAGPAARGATAYVTLEPCAHFGRTPPCADALIAAGIARAVVAIEDPDKRVDGRGLARLRAAGIATAIGVLKDEAAELNQGFLTVIRGGRPMVTLKLATTLDSRIATRTGESRWITGAEARAAVHLLRARHDAVLVGAGTAAIDDPSLTCRLPGLGHRSPVRLVLDGRLRLPLTHELVRSARTTPSWILTLRSADPDRRRALTAAGVELIDVVPDANGYPDTRAALERLGERGITRVLAEGGGRVAAVLIAHDLIDRIVWFRAASVIGGDGIPAVSGYGVTALVDAARFTRVETRPIGPDIVETYARAG